MSDGRKLDVGDVVAGFEVVTVTYQENNEGEKINFSYTVRDAKEVQTEREEAEEALKVLDEQRAQENQAE